MSTRAITRVEGTRFCTIEITLSHTSSGIERLSIVGIEGVIKRNGQKVVESCGQIRDELTKWFPEAVPFFKWHLNDVHAECVHQEARGETWTTHSSAVCPDCGYRLGSAWTHRELPPEVRTWALTWDGKTS